MNISKMKPSLFSPSYSWNDTNMRPPNSTDQESALEVTIISEEINY